MEIIGTLLAYFYNGGNKIRESKNPIDYGEFRNLFWIFQQHFHNSECTNRFLLKNSKISVISQIRLTGCIKEK